MGSRGAFSRSHGGVSGSSGGGTGYIPTTPESRADIRELFINRLGFQELYGTDKIGTAQMASLAQELQKIEKEHHVLRDNKVYLAVTNEKGTLGYAAQMKDGSYLIALNTNAHNNVGNKVKKQQSMAKSGFKTQTDDKITNDYSYTARHEYGHIKQYAITEKTGKSASQIRGQGKALKKWLKNNKL